MPRDREDAEAEPYVAFVVALDQAVDRDQAALLLDGEVRGVEGATPEVREKVHPVLAVQEHRDRDPGCHDQAREHRQHQAVRAPDGLHQEQHDATEPDRDGHRETLDGGLGDRPHPSGHRLVRGAQRGA